MFYHVILNMAILPCIISIAFSKKYGGILDQYNFRLWPHWPLMRVLLQAKNSKMRLWIILKSNGELSFI